MHPEDIPAPKTEQAMFEAIGEYVERLVNVIRPRQLLYMAIDGVAPRAKMNQQRSRRFKTAREMAEHAKIKHRVEEEVRQRGGSVPSSSSSGFDSNVITPGTEFMDRLAQYLSDFVMQKQNTSPSWRSMQVVLSVADAPGEGEHKIMEYIRRARQAPGYNPNIRHVLHGLDADLIMLGLATHEAHFTILREEVLTPREMKLRQRRGEAAEEVYYSGDTKIPLKPLYMLHIATLREYLHAEFSAMQDRMPFAFDLERVIDDFIFLCFFVGNDFLPHLPSLSIREGAVDLLINLYKQVLPSLGGYLTKDGEIDLARADVLLSRLGVLEDTIFRKRRDNDARSERFFAQRKAQDEAREAAAQRARSNPPGGAAVSGSGGGGRPAAAPVPAANADAASKLKLKKLGGKKKRRRKSEGDEGGEGGDAQGAAKAPRSSEGGDSVPKATAEGSADKGEEDGPSIATESGDSGVPDTKPGVDAEGGGDDDGSPQPEQLTEEEWKELVQKEIKIASIDESVQDHVRLGDAGWKERYYCSKLGRERGLSAEAREALVKEYIIGLQWVFAYYFRGVPSWDWYFPEHYAPFSSDLVRIDRFKANFVLGEPFKPIWQLMAVLPPQSAHALPEACRKLMTDPNSPLAEFYPLDFKEDPNGKKMTWQWIALLPFIDVKRLVDAIKAVEHTFTDDEKRRNTMGNEVAFLAATSPLGQIAHAVLPAEQGGSAKPLVRFSASEYSADGKGLSGAVMLRKGEQGTTPIGAVLLLFKQFTPATVGSNQILRLTFLNPPHNKHVCQLLPGASPPPPCLDVLDRNIRIPRLQRGMNIAELAFGGMPSMGNMNQRPARGLLGHAPGGGRGAPRGSMAAMGAMLQAGHSAAHHRYTAHLGYADERQQRPLNLPMGMPAPPRPGQQHPPRGYGHQPRGAYNQPPRGGYNQPPRGGYGQPPGGYGHGHGQQGGNPGPAQGGYQRRFGAGPPHSGGGGSMPRGPSVHMNFNSGYQRRR